MKNISIRDFSLFFALILIWIFFAMQNGQFLSPRNISMLGIELAMTTCLALGMLLVLLPGKIDLSVGSGAALIGGIATSLMVNESFSAPMSMLFGLLAAIGIWWAMGVLIVKQHVPAFIITLGGLMEFRGRHRDIIGNTNLPVGSDNAYSMLTTYYIPPIVGYIIVAVIALIFIIIKIRSRSRKVIFGFGHDDKEISFLKIFIAIQAMLLAVIMFNQYRGIPLSVLIFTILAFSLFLLTQHTAFGRHLYAIGGNQHAAKLSGIPVDRVVITAFVILGAIVALTGFIQAAYTGYSTPGACEYLELDAIAACVIGGTSLKGGRGTVLGVIFGSLIMVSLLNGMTLMSVGPETKLEVRGLVLIAAVWLDVYLARRAGIETDD
ncbi:MAG: ATPase [Planctomycetes bacterium]|nr:ATPase [Planctomycetota bacterium]